MLFNFEPKDAAEVTKALADRLFKDDSVNINYYEAMLNRERSYYTGQPTEDIKVAIPHVEVEHDNNPAFAIAALPKPVKFVEMASDSESALDGQIVMMLANADPAEQVKTLRKMVDLFDVPDSLHAIVGTKRPKRSSKS